MSEQRSKAAQKALERLREQEKQRQLEQRSVKLPEVKKASLVGKHMVNIEGQLYPGDTAGITAKEVYVVNVGRPAAAYYKPVVNQELGAYQYLGKALSEFRLSTDAQMKSFLKALELSLIPIDYEKLLQSIRSITLAPSFSEDFRQFSENVQEAKQVLRIDESNIEQYEGMTAHEVFQKAKDAKRIEETLKQGNLNGDELLRILNPHIISRSTRGRKRNKDYEWAYPIYLLERARCKNDDEALKTVFGKMLEKFKITIIGPSDELSRFEAFESAMKYRNREFSP